MHSIPAQLMLTPSIHTFFGIICQDTHTRMTDVIPKTSFSETGSIRSQMQSYLSTTHIVMGFNVGVPFQQHLHHSKFFISKHAISADHCHQRSTSVLVRSSIAWGRCATWQPRLLHCAHSYRTKYWSLSDLHHSNMSSRPEPDRCYSTKTSLDIRIILPWCFLHQYWRQGWLTASTSSRLRTLLPTKAQCWNSEHKHATSENQSWSNASCKPLYSLWRHIMKLAPANAFYASMYKPKYRPNTI